MNTVGTQVRLAIVEDHALMLDALVAALEDDPDIEVVSRAGTVGEFRSTMNEVAADVVLTDLALPDGSGIAVAALANEHLGVPVVLMTGQGDTDGITAAIDGGCAGFVSKAAGIGSLSTAISAVAAGATVFPADALRKAIRRSTPLTVDPLTDRESAVLRCLARGMSAAEIADHLVLSIHTVRNHIRAVLAKLQARSQLEAVVIGVRSGLVEIV